MDENTQDQATGAGAPSNAPSGATSGAAATTETDTANTSTPVTIPDHLQDAFPAGTTVEQTSDGQLKATVPGESGETESSVHHFFVEIEHGIEHLAERVKAFFEGDSSDTAAS